VVVCGVIGESIGTLAVELWPVVEDPLDAVVVPVVAAAPVDE
jgi:hypothetical protein